MKTPLLAAALAALLAGCAMPAGMLTVQKPPSSELAPGLSPAAAQAAIAPGRTTKSDVAATLGPATVVRFDSGYEVWVYQTRERSDSAREPTELVILFAPSGVVAKTRVRAGGPLRTRH